MQERMTVFDVQGHIFFFVFHKSICSNVRIDFLMARIVSKTKAISPAAKRISWYRIGSNPNALKAPSPGMKWRDSPAAIVKNIRMP